jgi:hypothetical protein
MRPRVAASREKVIPGRKRFAAVGRKERKAMKKYTRISILLVLLLGLSTVLAQESATIPPAAKSNVRPAASR